MPSEAAVARRSDDGYVKGGLSHGDSNSAEYAVWVNMRQRCFNVNSTGYAHYGGRGIQVCERWSDYRNFIADMGRRPSPEHTIERLDVNGNYEPSNCTWATRKEQANNRTNNVRFKVGDQEFTTAQLASQLNVVRSTIENRFKRGLNLDEVIEAGEHQSEKFSYKGDLLTIRELAQIAGVSYHTLYKRLKYQKLTAEEAVQRSHSL
jgi:DNA-binding transcriptional regulator YhcF (GntR family)